MYEDIKLNRNINIENSLFDFLKKHWNRSLFHFDTHIYELNDNKMFVFDNHHNDVWFWHNLCF